MTKNREKRNREIIFRSELPEVNNEPTFGSHQKIDKSRKKSRKLIFGSEFYETKNEPTFRIHQKN